MMASLASTTSWTGIFLFANAEFRQPAVGFATAALYFGIYLVEGETQTPMTLHDLRRTARSLMDRAKVPPDHAERCLAHKIGGVRGVYDRYKYLPEKRDALARLAAVGEITK
jgi:integrase